MSRIVIQLASICLAVFSVHAAVVTWTGDVDNDWLGGTAGVDTNWDTDSFPAAGDDVLIDLSAALVELNADLTASVFNRLTVSGDISARPSLYIYDTSGLDADTVDVAVNTNEAGYIELQSAWMYGDFLNIGTEDFANGEIRTFASTVRFDQSALVAGEKGAGLATFEFSEVTLGSLFIGKGHPLAVGNVIFRGGDAVITNLLEIGMEGRGDLTIALFNTLQTRSARAGVEPLSQGYIDLTSSQWNLDGVLRLGVRGRAQMSVSVNGFLQADGLPGQPSIIIAEFPGSEGELRIEEYGDAGATVNAANETIVGWRDSGVLRVGGQGSLTSGGLVLGREAGSRGFAEFRINSSSSVGNTIIGDQGEGFVEVSDGSFLGCANVEIARQAGSTGEVQVLSSARMSAAGSMFIGGSFTNAGSSNALVLVAGGGELEVSDRLTLYTNSSLIVRDALDGDGIASVGAGSASGLDAGVVHVRSNGILRGVGRVVGEVRALGGRVEPGLPIGALPVDGAFRLATGGVLRADIGGTAPGAQYDVINVASNASWEGGQVMVVLTNGFAPSAGQTFKVVDAGAYSGTNVTFDFSLAPLSPGLAWDTSTFLADGTLRVATSGPIELDCDLAFVGVDLAGTDLEVHYTGTVGTAYFIDATTNLVAPAWHSISSNLLMTAGVNTQFIGGVSTNAIRFFRLRCGTNAIPAP